MNTSIRNARKIVQWFLETTEQKPNYFTLEELKNMFTSVKIDYPEFINMLNESGETDEKKAFELVKTCLNACNDSLDDLILTELFDLINETCNSLGDDDFYIDNLPGGECRLIHKNSIGQIWEESLIEQIKDCHDLSGVPSFVKIDWEATAKNCMTDGMGHHFSSYDEKEHNAGDYYIFRTN